MALGMLTADWFLLGRDLYFRKFEIYSMPWRINANDVVAIGCPYGGPIAVTLDKRKPIKLQGGVHSDISIYSGSGQPITTIKWSGKSIVNIDWSTCEDLIIIREDGIVEIHNIFSNKTHSFTISEDLQVVQAVTYTNSQNFTGIVVMTRNFKFFSVNNIYDPMKRTLSDLVKSSIAPTSWLVVSESQQSEVLVARERELFRLKLDEHQVCTILEPDISHKYTSILDMAISINARHVVLFTNAGYLWLGSPNLRTKYGEVETGIIHKPKQLAWCGNEAVVAFWEQDYTLMIVGRHGEKMTYLYDGSVFLVPEIDGVRILSSTQHELLQKVPDVVQKIFRINSTDPGSFLLEASKQFQKRSHRADEYISLVKDNLTSAVEQCIEASGYEFDAEVQKMLIRAAQFGKCFVSDIDSEEYVKMCRLLRVLNAIRDARIGIPLTFTELEILHYEVLLDRLVVRRHYYLAIQIAKYLKMPEKIGSSRILVHWAKYKVSKRQSVDDETIAREIAEKLGNIPSISYSDIAKESSANGRVELAIKLLDYEPKSSRQVDLLLQLEKYEPALVKAIESGDNELIYDVILKFKQKLPMGEGKMLIRKYAVSLALYVKYCKEHDVNGLKEFLNQEDDHNSKAEQFILHLNEKSHHEKENSLASALDSYKAARNDLNASICEEALRLSKQQRQLEEKLKKPFQGLSVHNTCKELLVLREIKIAEKFKAEFKIPDKRFWWLRIQTLAAAEAWDELDKFSKVKKSPIGYAPFVDVCLQARKPGEAAKYLSRVSEELKVKYYVKANKLDEAALLAYEQRDKQGLLYVQSKCNPQSALNEKINDFLAQLDSRK